MKQLLNIQQAARFLNVSEMTVRRWTNAGALHCYRIGARRARRFRIEDLVAYLEMRDQPVSPPTGVPLGYNGLQAPAGTHLAHLPMDAFEALDLAIGYICNGLSNHETVCVVAPDHRMGQIVQRMRSSGVDPAACRHSGDCFFSEGMDTPMRQARFLAEVAERTGQRLRVFGDMAWAKEKGWGAQELRELEDLVNAAPSRAAGNLYLCQYALDRFSGQETLMAMETHSHCIYRGLLNHSPYHFP